MDTDLAQAEKAALHAWNRGPHDTTGMLAAVRAGLDLIHKAEDARLAIAEADRDRYRTLLAAIATAADCAAIEFAAAGAHDVAHFARSVSRMAAPAVQGEG